MALSRELIKRLHPNNELDSETLPKRLKLAKNVFCSAGVRIICKEDIILQWICSESLNTNDQLAWETLCHCLLFNSKSFVKLSSETRNGLITKTKETLENYPEKQVFEETLMCCAYIFSCTNFQNFAALESTFSLLKTLIEFTLKCLHCNQNKESALECTSSAIANLAEVCKLKLKDKHAFTSSFVEQIMFPLAKLVNKVNGFEKTSKISIETQKIIRRLFFDNMKNVENNDSHETYFTLLKNRSQSEDIEDLIEVYTCILQCAIFTFQKNSINVQLIIQKLVDCIPKTNYNQMLVALLENSIDITFNFESDNPISFKPFLSSQIENVLSIEKRTHFDYQLLSVISSINPVMVEEKIHEILKKVLFEKNEKSKEDLSAFDNLIKSLWKTSVCLRRHNKFLSELLLIINAEENKKLIKVFNKKFVQCSEFMNEFCKDLKLVSSTNQILVIFKTLLYHYKTNCDSLENDQSDYIGLKIKISTQLLVSFLENVHFLDGAFTLDWQTKFCKSFTELRDILESFAKRIFEPSITIKSIFLDSLVKGTNIWCEVYCLLKTYLPNLTDMDLEYPVNSKQIKYLKGVLKESIQDDECKDLFESLLFYKSVYYSKNDKYAVKLFDCKLWDQILEKNFMVIKFLTQEQLLKILTHLIDDIHNSESKLSKWIIFFDNNRHNMPENFLQLLAIKVLLSNSSSLVPLVLDCITDNEAFDAADLSKFLKKIKEDITGGKVTLKTLEADLKLLSNLPIIFLNKNTRAMLFLILYWYDSNLEISENFEEIINNLYLDFLQHHDINIFNKVADPTKLIEHFTKYPSVLQMIFQSTINDASSISCWESYASSKACDLKISSILINAIDNPKNLISKHKQTTENLIRNLSNKILKKMDSENITKSEISGLKNAIKFTMMQEEEEINDSLIKTVKIAIEKILQDLKISANVCSEEILQLFLIILNKRKHFDIDQITMNSISRFVMFNPCDLNIQKFLETMNDKEFNFFITHLSKVTIECLQNGKLPELENLVVTWENLSKAECSGNRSKVFTNMIINFYNDLLKLPPTEASSHLRLRINRCIVTSKRMVKFTARLVDPILICSTKTFNNLEGASKLTVCEQALKLCMSLLKNKPEFMMDRLPLLMSLFKKAVLHILEECKEISFLREQTLKVLVGDIEKFCSYFAKLKKDVARISPYLIADLLEINSKIGVLPQFAKTAVESSISHLLSNCDRHAVSFLSRTLPSSTQQVFKTIYDNYVKYHKFTGKI